MACTNRNGKCKRRIKYYDIFYFSRWRSCAILHVEIPEILTVNRLRGPRCTITVPHFVKIGQRGMKKW